MSAELNNVSTRVGLRPMSDMQQSRVTLSRNFVAQQSCLDNYQLSIDKQSPNKHGF